MRLHEPALDRRHELPPDALLASTADAAGRIVYANAACVEQSGFTSDELHSQPLDLLCQGDLPAEAIADMWCTLQAGDPWSALVKNRDAEGELYWTRANVAPVMKDGAPAGYLAVRTQASAEDIEAADRMYRRFQDKRAGALRFHKGIVVRSGIGACASWMDTTPVRWRLRIALLALVPLLVLFAALAGVTGEALGSFAALSLLTIAGACRVLEVQISQPLESVLLQARNLASGIGQPTLQMQRIDEIGMTLRAVNQLGLMFRWLVNDTSEQRELWTQAGAKAAGTAAVPVGDDRLASNQDFAGVTEPGALSSPVMQVWPAGQAASDEASERLAPFDQWRAARVARRRYENYDYGASFNRREREPRQEAEPVAAVG